MLKIIIVSLIIDLYFSIPAIIAQIFISTAELLIPVGIPTKEAKEKLETHPLIAETKIRKCSM